MRSLSQRLGLWRGQAGEAAEQSSVTPRSATRPRHSPEHSNLRLDMAPFTRRPVRPCQFFMQPLTHADNPFCHSLHFRLPFAV